MCVCVCVCAISVCVIHRTHRIFRLEVQLVCSSSPQTTNSEAHGPWPDSPTKSASLPRWDPRATAGDCSCRVACPWWHRTPLLSTELHFSSENPVIYWLNFLDAHFMTLCEEGIRWLTWVWGMGSYFSKKTGHPKRSTLICGYMMKSCWIHEFAAVNHGIHHQFHRLNPRLIAINHY